MSRKSRKDHSSLHSSLPFFTRHFRSTSLVNGVTRVSLRLLVWLQMKIHSVWSLAELAQTLCTIAAVVGTKSLASQISERIVALSGGMLFIIFGIQSFLTPVDA